MRYLLFSLTLFGILAVLISGAVYAALPDIVRKAAGDPFVASLIAGAASAALLSLVFYLAMSFRYRVGARAEHITEELFASKEWFRRLYDIAPIPYLMLSPDGRIRQPNKAALRLFGKIADDLYDAPFAELFFGEHRAEALQYVENYRRAYPVDARELMVRREDGTARWVVLSVYIIEERGKRTHHGLAALVDITERKEVERMKTEFVSLASHELRSPLSMMRWRLEVLLSGDAGALTDAQKTHAEKLYRRAHIMTDLVNLLLNVSRIEMGTLDLNPEMTDICDIARDTVEGFSQTIAGKRIALDERYGEDVVRLYSDPKLLRIIVQNLISNAIKYTPEGGTIDVTIARDGGFVSVSVADTGCGIPPEARKKIFTKLFRAENAVKVDTEGAGLGLYLTKSITEKLGGTIGFTSELGKGTTFTVRLPIEGLK